MDDSKKTNAQLIVELEELRKRNEELENQKDESGMLLSSIIESPENIIILSLDNNYRYTSFNTAHAREMKKVWGVDIELGKNILDYIPGEEDRNKAELNYKRTLNGEPFVLIEDYGDGDNKFWYELAYNPIFDENRNVVGHTEFITDITGRKQSEEALLESEKRLKEAQNVAHIGSWYYEIPDNKLIWSDETCRIFNIPLGTSLSHESFIEKVHPDDREYVDASWTAALKGEPHDIEHRIVVGDEYKWVHEKSEITFDEHGRAIKEVGTVQDITKRKKTEEALIESEERFKSIYEQSPIAIEIYNADGELIDVNASCLKLFGVISAEEVKEFNLYDDPNLPDDAKGRLLKGEAIKYESEFDFELIKKHDLYKTSKSGICFVNVNITPLKVLDGKHSGFLVQVIDVTERKKAEENLKKSEAMLREAEKISNIGSWQLNLSTNKVQLSDEMCRIFRINKDEFDDSLEMGMKAVHPDDRHKVKEVSETAIERGEKYQVEYRLVHSDGSEDNVITRGNVLHNDKGDIVEAIGTVQDITERKQAEKALVESEERHRLLFDNASLGIGYYDLDGTVIAFNNQAAHNMGGSPEDYTGKSLIDLFGQETGEVFKSRIKTASTSQTNLVYEDQVELPTGNLWYLSTFSRILGADGKVVGVQVISNNITESKLAEENLARESQMRTALLDNIPDCIALILKKGTREIVASNRFAREIGAIPGLTCFETCSLRDNNCPWCLAPTLWTSNQMQRTEIDYRGKWYEGIWAPLSDDLYVHYIFDITERKKAEEALAHSHDLMRYVIEHNRSAIAVHDRDMKYVYVSQRYLDDYKVKEKDVIGKHHYDVFPDLPQKWRDVHQKALAGEVSSAEDDPYFREDGSVDWTRWECRPWYEADGSIGGIIIYTEVITDRKKVEEELREERNKLDSIIGAMTSALTIRDRDYNLTYQSPQVTKIFGDNIGEKCYRVFEGNDNVCEGCPVELSFKDGEPHTSIREVTMPNGEITFWENTSNPIINSDGNILYCLEISTDITARKKAEEEIYNLSKFPSENPNPVIRISKEGTLIYANEQSSNLLPLLGFKDNEIIPKEALNILHDVAKDNIIKVLELPIGEQVYNVTFAPYDDYINIYGLDITERKKAEEALRDSEKDLRESQRIAHLGSWRLDLATNQVLWSEELYKMYGFDPTLPPPDYTEHMKLFTRESWDKLSTALASTRESGVPYELALETVRKDGSHGWMWVRGEAEIDSAGNTIGLWGAAQDITERKKTEEALLESEDFLNRTGDIAMVGGWQIDFETGKVLWTRTTGRIHELPDGFFPDLEDAINYYHPDDRELVKKSVNRAIEEGETFTFETRLITAKGHERWVRAIGQPIHKAGKCERLSGTFQDITERKKLEDQLVQSQKMESIGQLAGGIAHDFNNIIQAISLNAELSVLSVPPGSPLDVSLTEIKSNADRAADLTHQLLAFSRRQLIDPKIVQLNDIIENMKTMLGRLIGEDIEVSAFLKDDLWMVYIDKGQIEQIMTNLAVNARDAMPVGGKLTIETANVLFDEEYSRIHLGITQGEYVMLAVSDTGTGMDETTKAKIFEPFFTTKGVGKGTGLGLSTCYGIVKQNNGYIWVYSEPDKGTAFKIYLPRGKKEATMDTVKEISFEDLPKGTETILLVEDDSSVLMVNLRLLSLKGYNVLSASNGVEALPIIEKHGDTIHLLITDVVMPQMGGKEFAEKVHETYPDIKVLYISGYTDDSIVHHGVLKDDMRFLQKPSSSSDFLNKVRQVLDE